MTSLPCRALTSCIAHVDDLFQAGLPGDHLAPTRGMSLWWMWSGSNGRTKPGSSCLGWFPVTGANAVRMYLLALLFLKFSAIILNWVLVIIIMTFDCDRGCQVWQEMLLFCVLSKTSHQLFLIHPQKNHLRQSLLFCKYTLECSLLVTEMQMQSAPRVQEEEKGYGYLWEESR